MALVVERQARNRRQASVNRGVTSGWRNSTMPAQKLTLKYKKKELEVCYRAIRGNKFRFEFAEQETVVQHLCAGDGKVDLLVEQKRHHFLADAVGSKWHIQGTHGSFSFEEQPRFTPPGQTDSGGGQVAPMPGTVLSVAVKAGETVKNGQLLVILEAMKMEHRVTAPRDGKIEAVHVAANEQVANGQLMITLIDS